MMQHDLSCWPLVLSVSAGKPSLTDLHDYSAAWTAWLDRGEPFVMLRILQDSAANSHPPGGSREGQNWFKAETERFSSLTLALAAAAPPEVVLKKNRIKGGMQRGVPTRAFEQVEDALDWLLPHLQKKYEKLDIAALKIRALDWCAAYPISPD
ncbi:hypothetical protein [Cephaloticoccus primus]|uniref:hypothetical protein n=1 Tax=Cephaloticoccus primus TaxID=1548207 RepID=UPI0012E81543|nr:hypothetical protein [Cephaloticoccus primus]